MFSVIYFCIGYRIEMKIRVKIIIYVKISRFLAKNILKKENFDFNCHNISLTKLNNF